MAAPNRNVVLVVLGVLAVGVLGLVAGYALGGDDGKHATLRTEEPDAASDSSSTTTTATDGPAASESDGETADPVPDIAPPATVDITGLDPAALELATAINSATSLTYHAVYKGTHTGATGKATDVTVEVWHQLPLARRDTTIASAEGALRTRELRLRERVVGCVDTSKDEPDPKWVCVPSAGKGIDPAEPVLGTVRPLNGAVTVRDDTIGGVAARCFTVTRPGAKVQEACFDADGIPVSIDGGDGNIVRTEVGRGVDPATIVIPPGAEERSNDPSAPDSSAAVQPTT